MNQANCNRVKQTNVYKKGQALRLALLFLAILISLKQAVEETSLWFLLAAVTAAVVAVLAITVLSVAITVVAVILHSLTGFIIENHTGNLDLQ